MAPYLRSISYDDSSLLSKLEEKNKAFLEDIEAKLKEAEEREGDSEISELWRKKAMYLARIGDKASILLMAKSLADMSRKRPYQHLRQLWRRRRG